MSTTTIAISTLTSDGNLRFPASQSVRLLLVHYAQQHQTALTAGDEASEDDCMETLTDIESKHLDPVYWKELADSRLQSSGVLGLSRIPKAFWVMPQAVKFWRESRGAGTDGTEEENAARFLNFFE